MGGDDLGSDDERYGLGQLDPPRRVLGGAADGNRDSDDNSDDNSDDDHEARRPRHGGNKRRQRRQGEPLLSSSTASNEVPTKGPGGESSSLSAEEESGGGIGGGIGGAIGGGGAGHDDSGEGRRLFREAARVDEWSISRQASFVTRLCRCHYYRSLSLPDDPDAGTKTTTEPVPVAATPPPFTFTFLPSHLVSHGDRGGGNGKRKRDNVADDETNYLDKLKSCISAKKLKNWRASHSPSTSSSQHIASPCVIIVCSSARRAVTILKDLAPLKLPIAKLFPKNGSVSQQLELLAANNKGGAVPPVLAVGTPHRLTQLAQRSQSQLVQRTQLVVLDMFVSGHGATVGTAADTAPHCAAFLVEHVVPQLQSRNDLRIAFL